VFSIDCLSPNFTWIALDDIPLWFSFTMVRRANSVEEKINCVVLFYSHRNQSTHVTNGMTVMSLSASLLQKIRVTVVCICQIMLNWKLSLQFWKWYKYSSHFKVKFNCTNWDLPVLQFGILNWINCSFELNRCQRELRC